MTGSASRARSWHRRVAALVGSVVAASGTSAIVATSHAQASSTGPTATTNVPYQFIAKAYTELLGRAPDPSGWSTQVNYFQQNGCNLTSIKTFADGMLSGTEFAGSSGDYPSYTTSDAPAVTIALFRAFYNREFDAGGYQTVRNYLQAGNTPAAAFDNNIYNSFEFQYVDEPAICGQPGTTYAPDYGWGQPTDATARTDEPPLTSPDSGAPSSALLSEDSLYQLINQQKAAGGGTVWLSPRDVYAINYTLIIPSGVTLRSGNPTYNFVPGPTQYAWMARLVRGPNFSSNSVTAGGDGGCTDQTNTKPYLCTGNPLVLVEDGASLENVWVDGQRDGNPANGFGPHNFGDFNLHVMGGPTGGTAVSDNFITNTFGASNMEIDSDSNTAFSYSGLTGAASGYNGTIASSECSRTNWLSASYNLIDGYTTYHHGGLNSTTGQEDHVAADGIGDYCEYANIDNNQIVDTTDGGVLLFGGGVMHDINPTGGYPMDGNSSQVAYNTIVSAGNAMEYGVNIDPRAPNGSDIQPSAWPAWDSYFGDVNYGGMTATVHDNTLFTGNDTHFDVVIGAGSEDLFGDQQHTNGTGSPAYIGGPGNSQYTGQVALNVYNNSSGGQETRTRMAMYTGGLFNVTWTNNNFPDIVSETGEPHPCPLAAVVAVEGGSTVNYNGEPSQTANNYAIGWNSDLSSIANTDPTLLSATCLNDQF